MTVTAYRRSALAGMLLSVLVALWQGEAAVATVVGSLPLHLFHLALYGVGHAGAAVLAYAGGFRGFRYFHREAKKRELPRARRKALARATR